MPPYRTDVATLTVPETWQDQSITAFRLPPAPGGGDASFVITKDPGKGVTAFDAYIEKQVETCRRSLPDFAKIKRDSFEAAGRNCAWVEFEWVKDRDAIRIRQIYFDCGFFATICTLTAAAADIDYHDGEWRRVMASLAFEAPAAAPAFP